jgi:hypothetical protein
MRGSGSKVGLVRGSRAPDRASRQPRAVFIEQHRPHELGVGRRLRFSSGNASTIFCITIPRRSGELTVATLGPFDAAFDVTSLDVSRAVAQHHGRDRLEDDGRR